MAHTAHAFICHNWGVDKFRYLNHFCVPLIIKELQDISHQIWFDGARMKGDHFEQMAQGIQNTQSVIVFITQKYIEKVKGDNVGDDCKQEFSYALVRKTSSNMALALMVREMCKTWKWTGPVPLNLSRKIYFDMSGELKNKTYFS